MNTYKTKDGSERTVPGIGSTVGGIIKTDDLIESPLFELVKDAPADPAAAAPAPVQAPAPQTTEIKENQA